MLHAWVSVDRVSNQRRCAARNLHHSGRSLWRRGQREQQILSESDVLLRVTAVRRSVSIFVVDVVGQSEQHSRGGCCCCRVVAGWRRGCHLVQPEEKSQQLNTAEALNL